MRREVSGERGQLNVPPPWRKKIKGVTMNGLQEINNKLYGLQLAKWRRQDRFYDKVISTLRIVAIFEMIIAGVLI